MDGRNHNFLIAIFFHSYSRLSRWYLFSNMCAPYDRQSFLCQIKCVQDLLPHWTMSVSSPSRRARNRRLSTAWERERSASRFSFFFFLFFASPRSWRQSSGHSSSFSCHFLVSLPSLEGALGQVLHPTTALNGETFLFSKDRGAFLVVQLSSSLSTPKRKRSIALSIRIQLFLFLAYIGKIFSSSARKDSLILSLPRFFFLNSFMSIKLRLSLMIHKIISISVNKKFNWEGNCHSFNWLFIFFCELN